MAIDLTDTATLLTALRCVLEQNVPNQSDNSREDTVRFIDAQLDALHATGMVAPAQVGGRSSAVNKKRTLLARALVQSLYGDDTVSTLRRAGQI
ncbi:hypothetical protein [Mycobacterium sp. OTB74]|jgi:hypothetical protein|uniref:hypothetical protein n=1 Tax=Mycobacterium sp. OTB74 TaxID=1853452 RepID=UPI002476646F|nr:hypothetical protein [Mycobacterium sp. OTB74]MDH6245498.1 hypothetical protein [Mycobacterium sp. OTB74]